MIYTIGHSTLSKEDFLDVVKDVDVILDVRSHPGSVHEQFRKEQLEVWLPEAGKRYDWEPGLGGWRADHAQLAPKFADKGVDVMAYTKGKFPKGHITKKTETLPLFDGPLARPIWTNLGFYDYSWFMSLPEFIMTAEGLMLRADLLSKSEKNVGIMCCEVKWWGCHRSMIADYLWWRGVDSIHLQPRRTNHSSVIGNRFDRYNPQIIEAWKEWKSRV